jgi:hypothetical protein
MFLVVTRARRLFRIVLFALAGVVVPACTFSGQQPQAITPLSEIVWDRQALDEGLGWKLCVDAHPCVDRGPITAKASDGISQTYRARLWSDSVAPYLTEGTHRLTVVVYRVARRSSESRKSATLMVRVGAK